MVKKRSEASTPNAIRRLESLINRISKVLNQGEKVDTEALNKAIRNFETQVEGIIERTDEIDKIQEILNDKYYFPSIDSVISFIQNKYAKKVTYSKSRKSTVWTSAKIIAANGGVKRLKEEISSIPLQHQRDVPLDVGLYGMSLDEIEKELNDSNKYPDDSSLKKVLRGVLPSKKISDLHTREGLVQAALEYVRKKRGASIFSERTAEKKDEFDEG